MFNQAVGRRIRGLREEKKMSREELAAKADISPKFLYEIENGKKGLSANTLLKVSRALSCSCDYILGGIYEVEEVSIKEMIYTELPKGLTDKQLKLVEEVLRMITEINAGV